MAVLTPPSEEELYLLAILEDPTGLDIAELFWHDSESADGCYRAWDYQWPWYICEDQYQVDQGGRATGKTVGIQMRVCAFPFSFPGQKMLITAPELNHLQPLTAAIEERLTSSRMLREMLPDTKGRGVLRNPHWEVKFNNGSKIVSRLPGLTGKGVKGCLAEGTLILTRDRGQVPIEEVMPGEYVLTHRNRWRRVVYTYIYESPNAIEVSGGGHRGLIMSDSHAMYVRLNEAGIKSKRSLAAPDFETMSSLDHELDKYGYLGSPNEFPSANPPSEFLNPDLMRLVGRYVADGHLTFFRMGTDRETSGRINITVSETQLESVLEMGESFSVTYRRRSNGTYNVEFSDTKLARAIRSEFGVHADGKKLPSWLLGAPRVYREAFLHGYLSGDGHWDATKCRWTAGSASKALALGVKLLAQSLGFTASYSWVDPKVTSIMGAELKSAPKRSHRITMSTSGHPIIDEGANWAKIRKIITSDYSGKVYDLTVDEDHSYIADGLISSNQHVVRIEMDEAQDYPEPGWVEIRPCLNAWMNGAAFYCHGVPKGTRGNYYEVSKDSSNWTVHHPMGFMRPSWTAEERSNLIKENGGSRQNIDYKRNVYGEHGDMTHSVFVLSRLIACVDMDQESFYNTTVYMNLSLTFESIPEGLSMEETTYYLKNLIDPPGEHRNGWSQKVTKSEGGRSGLVEVGAVKGYSAYFGGMDVGVTNHPSEILIFGQRADSDKVDLLTRINLQRINTDDQKEIVVKLFEAYGAKLKWFAIDKGGVGFPIWNELSRYPVIGSRIMGVNFSEKRVVAFEDREMEQGETWADLAIERNVIEQATDWLRNDLVDAKRLRLPNDNELIMEFQGQSYTTVKDTGDPYGKRRLFSGGSFHTLDAAKMFTCSYFLPEIEARLLSSQPREPVLDIFVGEGMY